MEEKEFIVLFKDRVHAKAAKLKVISRRRRKIQIAKQYGAAELFLSDSLLFH